MSEDSNNEKKEMAEAEIESEEKTNNSYNIDNPDIKNIEKNYKKNSNLNLNEDKSFQTNDDELHQKEEENIDNQVDNSEQIKEELITTKDKLLRALAENENTRKQMEKIRQEANKYGVQPLARELLNIVDNFERAIKVKSETSEKALEEGFILIQKDIISILEKFNVQKINAIGNEFDANFHQAMFEKETDEYEEGLICEIIQDGYTFHDRLLRPAMVGVAKKKVIEQDEENKVNDDNT